MPLFFDRSSFIFLGIILSLTTSNAQNTPTTSRDNVQQTLPLYRWPYAGKIAPRIGGSGESANDKVRLDIGGTVALYERGGDVRYEAVCGHDAVCDNDSYDPYIESLWNPLAINLSLGVDFFTWSRLRSEANFKFPVEAVDYYFGVYGSTRLGETGDVRDLDSMSVMKRRTTFIPTVRVAHISAHLVDGDPQFALPNEGAVVYSREFVDLSLAMEHLFWMGCCRDGFHGRAGYLRPYIGAQVLFHTIPDDLGRVTPYIGADLEMELLPGWMAPTVRGGYEFRLNTEEKTIGEHSVRAGIKLAPLHHNGILLEAAYYSGRSQFGQYFGKREEYFSIGFGFGK